MDMTPQDRFDEFIKEQKIELKTKFIPFSFSRDAGKIDIEKEKDKLYRAEGLTLNWKVTVSGDKSSLTTDYSKGIGHLDYGWNNGFTKIRTVDEANKANHLLYEGVENGKAYQVGTKKALDSISNIHILKSKPFPTPELREVLHSLVLDAEVLNHANFESWASDCGYDVDSRKAEKTYNACKESAADLLKVVGSNDKINTLREILYDLENEPTPKKPKI